MVARRAPAAEEAAAKEAGRTPPTPRPAAARARAEADAAEAEAAEAEARRRAEAEAAALAAARALGPRPERCSRARAATRCSARRAARARAEGAALVEPPDEAAGAVRARRGRRRAARAARAAARATWWRARWRVPEMRRDDAVLVGVVAGATLTLPLLVLTPGAAGDEFKVGLFDRSKRVVVGGGLRWNTDDEPEFSLSKTGAL